MKKRRALLLLATTALSFGAATAAFLMKHDGKFAIRSDAELPTYTLTLDNKNGVEAAAYAPVLETKTFNFISLNHLLVKAKDGGYAKIAPHGTIYNYAASDGNYHGRVTGIKSITVDFSGGDLFYQVSRDLSGKIFTEKASVTSETAINLTNLAPSYFILSAGDNELDVNSITITYSCTERAVLTTDQLGKVYTGEKNSIVYKATITGSNVALVSLNKESNESYTGTVSIQDGQVVFALQGTGNLFFTPNDGRTKLTVDATKGIGAGFAGLAFDEVFTVDDFEGYSGDGVGYDTDHMNFNAMSGLRSAFHVDYYKPGDSTASLLQDKNWQLMPSGSNYAKYQASGGYENSAFALLQSHGNGDRFVSFPSLYNVPATLGKGAKLSFWAHGPIKPDSSAAANPLTIKIRTLHNNPITGVNDANGAMTPFTIPAGSDWTHYEIPLDSNKEYYGYSIYMQNQWNYYLPIDNIEIYTADPYAEYVAPAVHVSSVTISPDEVSVQVGKTSALTAEVLPANADNKTVSWESSDASVATVSSEGVVRGVSVGTATITATTVDGGLTDTCDVEVIAAVAEPNGPYAGIAVAGGNNVAITIAIGTNGPVAVNLAGTDAGASGYTYNSDTKKLTIPTTGKYLNMTFGNVTADYDEANDQLINISCDGGIAAVVSNNGNITATKDAPLAHFDCEGTTSELQAIFKRRWGGSNVDTTNSDRITSNTTNFASGESAVTLRGYSGGDVRLNLQSDFASPITVNKFGFWVYNPSATAVKLRLFVYQSVSLANAKEFTPEAGVDINSNGWTYLAYELPSAYTTYNIQIADFTKSGVYLTFDEISLYNTLS